MHPVIASCGPFAIYSYGLLVAAGFGAAVFFMHRRAQRFGLDKNRMADLAAVILITGIIGARIFYVVMNIGYYRFHALEVFNLSKGGLVWYGGFLGGLIAALIYIKRNKMPKWTVGDMMAPYIALAQAIGRIGCFLNGCCFGIHAPAKYPFGVVFPNDFIARHPTQLYSAFAMLAIAAILRIWQDRRRFEGEVFLGYCILYASKRFFMEFLRGDTRAIFLNLTVFQLISAAIFVISLGLFIRLRNQHEIGQVLRRMSHRRREKK